MAAEEKREQISAVIAMPTPTAWPFVAAFGVTLGFAGLVTHVSVSIVGVVLFLRGAIGWWREVLPVEQHEDIRVRPVEQRAAPVTPAPHAVEHLRVGEAGHRVRIPVEIHPYSAGIKGGIVGGVAMAMVALAYGLVAYGSVWYPINLLAAAAMPALAQADLAQLRAFSGMGFIVALISHGVLSILVGLLYAVLLPMLPSRFAAFWGSFFAPLFWTGLLWASLGILNPALNQRIDWLWFIASQIAFGLTTGYVVAHSETVETMQTWPLAMRAGIEAPGIMEEREDRQQ